MNTQCLNGVEEVIGREKWSLKAGTEEIAVRPGAALSLDFFACIRADMAGGAVGRSFCSADDTSR